MFSVSLHVVLQQIAAIVLPRILQRDIRLVPGSECKCERLHAVLKHIDVLLLPWYCMLLRGIACKHINVQLFPRTSQHQLAEAHPKVTR